MNYAVVENVHMPLILGRTLTLALAGLLTISALVLAATETVVGTIQDIDVQRGTMTLMTRDDQTRKLRVSAEQIENLQDGDRVEVEVEDGVVRRIRKVAQS